MVDPTDTAMRPFADFAQISTCASGIAVALFVTDKPHDASYIRAAASEA